jgi:signal transduction histidine kinase
MSNHEQVPAILAALVPEADRERLGPAWRAAVDRVRLLESEAAQSEKLAGLGRLAAGIVHEINNPLVAVTMYSESLCARWAGGGANKEDLEKLQAIRDAGLRIQKLTRDLTAYARPSSGRAAALDLAPLLDQAALICKPVLKGADAVLQRDLQEVPQVSGSRSALTQVFVNLLTNAAQAIRPGGTIRLGLRLEAGRVEVTIADDGAGMTEEVQAQAFEPFFTTRPGRGVGLGLPTVKEILDRHGGAVVLRSVPGQGTTVTVSLPPQLSGVSTA